MRKFFKIPIFLMILVLLCPTVVLASTSFYDPANEGILSSYYYVDREKGFITGIAPGTTADHLLSVCLPNDLALSQDTVATGTLLTSGSCMVTAIVTGDVNGDGAVTITDLLMIKSAILGEPLSETASAAADVNYDGSITITDFLQVKSNLLGLSAITSGWPLGATATGDPILLSPGTSQLWKGGEGTASYTCDNPAIATVDTDGRITGVTLGSTLVYALNGEGVVISRVMVSVLSAPLTISLDRDSLSLTPSQSATISASLSHPIAAAVSWSSSNEAIATVTTDGTVTAHSFGNTVISATLANGSSEQVAVTVAPPLTSLAFERPVYKVRPGNFRFPKLVGNPTATGEEIIWTSSDTSIASVSTNGTVSGISNGTVTITATGKYTGLTANCEVCVCNVHQMAITFDDGPSGNTCQLLDYLKSRNIPATFFLVGNMIEYNQEAVIREAAEGHEIGYHSYAHQNQKALTSEQITQDFDRTNQILMELTGKRFTLWRSPGGSYDQRVLDCIPLPHIFWSVDTHDWQSLNADAVYQEIVNNSWDGSIILLHDLYGSSVQGAMRAMDTLISSGFEFLTVTELLSRDGTPPENCVNYYND